MGLLVGRGGAGFTECMPVVSPQHTTLAQEVQEHCVGEFGHEGRPRGLGLDCSHVPRPTNAMAKPRKQHIKISYEGRTVYVGQREKYSSDNGSISVSIKF